METEAKAPNKQLYENSLLRSMFEEDDLSQVTTRPFFGQKDPNLAILREKPEHRILLMLKARGLSNREIAEQSGYTEPWISQLMRQPWAKALLSEFITESGLDVLETLIKSEAVPSFQKLLEVRDMELTPKTASVVASACVSILERHLGKPAQHVKVESSNTTTLTTVNEVDARIEELEKETNRLLGVKKGPNA